MSIAVLVLGLLTTAALSSLARANYLHNERREVSTQAKLAAAALAAAPADLQRRLGRPTTLMAATGKTSLFDQTIRQSVPQPFVSVRLFHMVDGTPELVHSLGKPTQLDTATPSARALLRRAAKSGALTVTRVAAVTKQRLGYAFAGTALGQTYIAYAEQLLPGDRQGTLPAGSPLADMRFALYYGKSERTAALIETNSDHLPLSDQAARVPVTFGDQVLLVAMTPRTPLLGRFAAFLPWLFGGVGIVLTALMVLLTERLSRRRLVAEQLAEVTGQLYTVQRDVATTLQTALLPTVMPHVLGLAVGTRYRAGTQGIEVGGDWYDLIELPGPRVFFTIGDVSGRGLTAATIMSRVRHSIAAYAVEGNDPATVLTKVSALIDLVREGHFATALCGIVDLGSNEVTIANAGHLPLVLVCDGVAKPVVAPVEPPLGIGTTYTTTVLPLPPSGVLLAYTDGLVERRCDPIDAGIAHLCRAAGTTTDVEALLDTVLDELVPRGAAEDDIALLGMQWNA